MLPHVGGEDAVAPAERVQPIEHVLRAQPAALGVLERELLAPIGDLLEPVLGVELADERQEIFDRQLGVAGQRDVRAHDLVELGHVDVDVDLGRPHAELRQLAGDAVVPAGADRHDQVAVHDRLVGVGGAVHAEHPLVQRMVLGAGPLAEQRVHDRRLELLGQLHDGRARAGDHRAVPDVEHRLAAAGDEGGRLVQRLLVRMSRHRVAGQIHLVGERRAAGGAGDVLGQIHQHRPRAPRAGEIERLARDARDVVGVLHQVGVLHHRVGDAGDVGLLEGVLAEHRRDGLAGEDDHRHRVHQRRQQAGHRVGGAGTGGHQHHARLAGRARVAVGHVRGPLLVADEDQLDLRVDERVEDRHRGAARQAEDVLDPFALEAADQRLGTGLQLGRPGWRRERGWRQERIWWREMRARKPHFRRARSKGTSNSPTVQLLRSDIHENRVDLILLTRRS